MTARNYSNTAPPVALSVAVNTSATTFTVASTAGFPAVPFLGGVDRGTALEEVVLVTAITSTTFTVQRGYDGTTPKSHGQAAVFEHCVASIEYREANVHVNTPHNIGNALPTPGTPHASAVGDAGATGTAVEPARADHTHAREAFGNPVSSAPGDTVSQGTATTVARSDHKHARESAATIRDSATPPGVIQAYAAGGGGAPAGWLFANGQFVSRTTYAALFNIIGTYYGAGDGATTFNVPDLRGRTIAGLDNTTGNGNSNRLASANYGNTGVTLGAATGFDAIVLTQGQMPQHTHGNDPHTHIQYAHGHNQDPHNHGQDAHSHGINDPGHSHPAPAPYQFVISSPNPEQNNVNGGFNSGNAGNAQVTFTSGIPVQYTGISVQYTQATNQASYINLYQSTAVNQNATINIQTSGNNEAHLNVQPTMILPWIIKT